MSAPYINASVCLDQHGDETPVIQPEAQASKTGVIVDVRIRGTWGSHVRIWSENPARMRALAEACTAAADKAERIRADDELAALTPDGAL